MPKLKPTDDRQCLDFATIFAHMWYRDFPFQPHLRDKAPRADWTIHIGITVRSTADLMGLFTNFESGGRTDAVLKDNQENAVAAVEWEWSGFHSGEEKLNEFEKLRKACKPSSSIRFACLIGYAVDDPEPGNMAERTKRAAEMLDSYTNRWTSATPLLLVVVRFQWKGNPKRRQFKTLTIDRIAEGGKSCLRVQPACPWEVKGSRWEQERKKTNSLAAG